MEFVLVTTNISTPESSRSGSVMKFGDYREDDQRVDEAATLPLEKDFLQITSDSDDEDQALLDGFNALSARHRLVSHDFCTKVTLDQDQQKALQLIVGVHISEENPWKQIRKETLLDALPDDDNAQPEQELRLKLLELADDALVLVGFAAAITDDIDNTDTFLFYADSESSKESVSLIQRLEAFERQRVNRVIYKYPRPWKNLGSDAEVDLQIETKPRDKHEVEVQRLCSSSKIPDKLSFRFADDVRDGYVELVPKNKNFDVVMRPTVSIGIQSAAQRVEREQQTDPTFPANAWSQYSYELPVDPNKPEEDVEDNDETEVEASSVGQEVDEEDEKSKDFIGPSDAMKELIRVLEFNAIDMYRDDYELIASESMKQYVAPVITEFCCFIDPTRCADRLVSAFAWHPYLSGIFVTSYTYKALNTFAKDEKISDEELNKQSVMLSNPVLMWSFVDSLYPKLILESPREVTFLSFCPYDADVLIGGLITGQLIIWDLKNCLHRIEHPAELTDKQERNRKKMLSFMTWSKFAENMEQNIVRYAAISHYELSHKKLITSIKWLNRKHYVASTGLISETIKPNEKFRQFVSASLDGTVLFWDLDFMNADISPTEVKRTDTKKQLSLRKISVNECASPYDKLNGVFRPIYAVACEQPISSMIFDEGLFRYEPKTEIEDTEIEQRIEFNVIHEQQEKASNRLLISSLLGSIGTFIWEGFMYKEGKPEKAKQIELYGTIHNGPVLSIERNPFMPNVHLSVGQKIFAIWSECNQSVPVLWRRRETNITCAQWSPTRISLFFIARYDGIIELWDLLTRTDEACITHNAGTSIITVIAQHKLSLPTDVLMIADEKANLRAFTLPTISQPIEDDHDKFKDFINTELKRKEQFIKWQEVLSEKNGDLEESKQLLREESRRTLESPMPQQSEKDTKVKDEKRHSSVGFRSKSVAKTVKSKNVFDHSDRLHKKWEEMMVKRLMKTMLTLKRFDPEQIAVKLAPERDRQAYNLEKKRAIEENFKKVQHEICEIRARLMPPKDVDQEAERLQFITTNVDNILTSLGDGLQYDMIKSDLDKKLNASKENMVEIEWHELIDRARITRFERSKSIFEKRRKAYLRKTAQINVQIKD